MNVEAITKELEAGVHGLFEGDAYKQYLACMAKFHQYSFNNSLLIFIQKPEARMVAGYQAWQKKFNRQVKKGEKAIHILAPVAHKITKSKTDEDGNKEDVEVKWTSFRPVNVFDISQTEGEELPTIVKELSGNVDGYEELLDKLCSASPVPVGFEDIQTGAKGYYNSQESRIAIKEGMSQSQTIKTLVHEIGHSIMHGENGVAADADRETKEVQAESVAFVVCSALGLDTSEYSFGYVVGWGGDKELKQLTASMEIIRKTASAILDRVA